MSWTYKFTLEARKIKNIRKNAKKLLKWHKVLHWSHKYQATASATTTVSTSTARLGYNNTLGYTPRFWLQLRL